MLTFDMLTRQQWLAIIYVSVTAAGKCSEFVLRLAATALILFDSQLKKTQHEEVSGGWNNVTVCK
jgi:hypothetical protein